MLFDWLRWLLVCIGMEPAFTVYLTDFQNETRIVPVVRGDFALHARFWPHGQTVTLLLPGGKADGICMRTWRPCSGWTQEDLEKYWPQAVTGGGT